MMLLELVQRKGEIIADVILFVAGTLVQCTNLNSKYENFIGFHPVQNLYMIVLYNCSSLSHIPKRSNTQPRSSDVSTPAMKVTRSCVVPPQRGEKKVKQCHMCRTPLQSTSCHHLHSFVQVQLYQLFDHSVMHSIHYFIHVIRI